MSLPVLLHSGLKGAPSLSFATNGSMNALLLATLVNGFNTQAVSSATAAGGVVTFNFPTDPGFPDKYTVVIEGSSNASVNGTFRVQSAASNQVLVAIPGVPDGAVGGTMTMKFAPLGWTRAFNSGTTTAAYRQGGGAAHKRFLRVYDGNVSTASHFYLRAYENMTAISTGTGPFPTSGEKAGNGVDIYCANSPARPWIIVGTPRAFYFLTDPGNDYSAVVPPVFTPGFGASFSGFAFGEMDRVQRAGDVYAYFLSVEGLGSPYFHGSRASTQAANSRPNLAATSWGGAKWSGEFNNPDPVSGNLIFHDAPVIIELFNGMYGVRGYMPGILSHQSRLIVDGLPNLPGKMYTAIPGLTGRAMLMSVGWGSSEFMVKMDEDWGDV